MAANGKTRVVIVGGSFAGLRVRTLLEDSDLDVTLVDSREYWEYTPGVLRALVEPSHIPDILVPHKPDVIAQRAIGVKLTPGSNGGVIILADGTSLVWDHLVLATGSGYAHPIKHGLAVDVTAQTIVNQHPASPSTEIADGILAVFTPTTREQRITELLRGAQQLSLARSVVIVGGGPVGVELAAEIVGVYGRKKAVTLITTSDRLLAAMPARAGQHAAQWLQQRGVELIMNDKVTTWPEGSHSYPAGGEVITAQGRHITADLVYNCAGYLGVVHTELFEDLAKVVHDDEKAMTDAVQIARRKGVPVAPTLQVQGFNDVWAAGDVAGLPVEKTAYGADLQASCVAANIVRSIKQQPLLQYPEGVGMFTSPGAQQPVQAVISLYKHHGIMQMSRTVIYGRLPALVKAMVEMFQMQVAAGSWLATKTWLLMEKTTTNLVAGLARFTGSW